VLKTVAYKVQKQADNIVINLADSPLSIEAIEQALKVNPIDKLKRLFVMKGDNKRIIEVQR
jgi:filamentous hemagglutinin